MACGDDPRQRALVALAPRPGGPDPAAVGLDELAAAAEAWRAWPPPPLPPITVVEDAAPLPPDVAGGAADADDPLVPLVTHDRLHVIEAYRRTGWRAAVAGAHLRASVARRLDVAVAALPPGLGIAVLDGWRPLALQAELHAVAYADPDLPPGFVAEPCEDPTTPPPHLTGGTVDCTLSFRGRPLGLGTTFDEFTEAAHADHLEPVPGLERDLRRLLVHVMTAAGFVVLHDEWWHFEHGTAYWSAVTGHPPRFGPIQP